MKIETRKNRKLLDIKEWLNKARLDLEPRYLKGNTGEFMLLIAVEQLVAYLEIEKGLK